MRKCNNFIFGAVCSGVLLTGCALNAKQPEPVKTQPVKTEADIKQEALIKDLSLAKFMFENKNDAKAFEMFLKYAAEGNTEAEAWLGRCYMNGIGTPVNYDKAFEYFSKAAAKNHPYGINGLGVCKQYGYGTGIDLRAAIDYYKKASDMGFPLSTLNLARSYSDQRGGFYDEKLAEEYFKKAVAAGANGAKGLYASFLIERKRYSEAFPLLQDAKDFYSMMSLAQCYENGWGVNIDIKKSLSIMEEAYRLPNKGQWGANSFYVAGLEEMIINGQTDFARHCFKVGAEQGDRECLYIYAITLKDSGLPDDAIKFMMQAADKGYDYAQLEVGKMLKDKKNFTWAIKYLTMATLSERTKYVAVEILSGLYHDLNDQKQKNHWSIYGQSLGIASCRNNLATEKLLTEVDENIAVAAAWSALSLLDDNKFGSDRFYEIMKRDYDRLRVLADKGNGDALFALGVLGCLNEDKKHPNLAIGLELLERAVNQKDGNACNILGNIYRIGSLFPKDLKKALAWYQQGADLNDTRCALWVATLLFNEKEFEKTTLEEFKKAFEKCISLNEYSMLYEYAQVMEFVAKDLKKAEELYRWAAKQGDTRAMIHLYDFLLKNNPDDAWDYLLKAVDLEDPYAEMKMADIQRFVWNQSRIAYALYLKANIHGESCESYSRLAECYLTGYGCEPNAKMFWKAAEEAYKNGSATICLTLGNVYRDGKICPRDLKKAKEYYAEGVKRGDENCKKELSELK